MHASFKCCPQPPDQLEYISARTGISWAQTQAGLTGWISYSFRLGTPPHASSWAFFPPPVPPSPPPHHGNGTLVFWICGQNYWRISMGLRSLSAIMFVFGKILIYDLDIWCTVFSSPMVLDVLRVALLAFRTLSLWYHRGFHSPCV